MSAKSKDGSEHEPVEYASPACFMHEVDPAYSGLAPNSAAQERGNILRWRKLQRELLIRARVEMAVDTRADYAARITRNLDALLPDLVGRCVSLYWPIRAEPDLRPWAASIRSRGALCALPVVVEKRAPMVFRAWREGEPLTRGVWGIPIPAADEEITPDVVIAPVVGFDAQAYRLGYGGGFYDRTLAGMVPRPRIIGVGFGGARIRTIYPLPHDIGMDVVVTEDAIIRPAG